MELKDMNFPQVLGLNIFRDELYAQMQIELQALKEASRHGKVARMALTSLIDKGKFNTTEFTTAYYHIVHKEATGFSANERQYITDVCTIAYTKTIRRLQQESNENRRNLILRWWRMLTAWLKMKLNQNRSEDEKL